ncbi:hypothetical protein D3C81_1182050 [compost metagenome]
MLKELDIGHAAHEAIGIGEEAPFREHPGVTELVHHLGITEAIKGLLDFFMLGQRRAHLAEVPAFDQGQAVLHDIATTPNLEQVANGHTRGHAVLAGVQRHPRHVEAPVQTQPEGIVQQALTLHAIEHAIGVGTRGHVEQLLLANVQGLLQRRIHFPG